MLQFNFGAPTSTAISFHLKRGSRIPAFILYAPLGAEGGHLLVLVQIGPTEDLQRLLQAGALGWHARLRGCRGRRGCRGCCCRRRCGRCRDGRHRRCRDWIDGGSACRRCRGRCQGGRRFLDCRRSARRQRQRRGSWRDVDGDLQTAARQGEQRGQAQHQRALSQIFHARFFSSLFRKILVMCTVARICHCVFYTECAILYTSSKTSRSTAGDGKKEIYTCLLVIKS